MTDRELLELAAKADGIKLSFLPDNICRDVTGLHPEFNLFAAPTWNPLADDGDTLRPAVTLNLTIMFPD